MNNNSRKSVYSSTISSRIGTLIVRQAVAKDLLAFYGILEEAKAWFAEHDIKQWIPGVHNKDLSIFEKMIEDGRAFLVEHDGMAIATCQLSWSPPEFWHNPTSEAGYLATLYVKRSLTGKGIGRAILQWAENVVAKRGQRLIRLDCSAGNAKLCRYYENAGYVAVRELETYPGYAQKLYEKQLPARYALIR